MQHIQIVSYRSSHQPDIDAFMHDITAEFAEPVTRPTSLPVALSANYWVAECNNSAIGTVAVDLLQNNSAVLRRMMLKKNFRSAEPNVAALLLHITLDWCHKEQVAQLYLGTMHQFKAAQRFYEKHGFTTLEKNKLPADFPVNLLDGIFYQLNLTTRT